MKRPTGDAMRIAIDARELSGHSGGVGRYLSELLAEWAGMSAARRHEWTLVAHATPSVPASFAGRVEVVPGDAGTVWEQWRLARALRALRPDVLFAPGYTAPIAAPCPVALTIHDVSYCAHPEWFSVREGWRRRVLTRWSARRAAVVLTDSRFSTTEIVRFTGVPQTRIRTIPLGVRRPSTAAPTDANDREPMLLYVGSIFERRHVERLIAAFVRVVAARVPGARLEIVGEHRLRRPMSLQRALADAPSDVRGRISLRSSVGEDVLADLYRRASAFAFLSEYEGFGLTPLEALAAGVPPVVLDTPVAREVYAGAARYVTARDSIDELGRAFVEVLTSTEARSAMLRHASEVLSRYDWTRTAAATLAALEESAGA